MKQLLTSIAAVLFMGCSESVDKLSTRPQAESIKKTIPKDVNIAESTRESQLASYLKNGKKCIAVAQFGIYESVAILNLNPKIKGSNTEHIPISGTYYYLKHAKKIDLEGHLDLKVNRIVLQESHNGKVTGNIQFSGNDNTKNYWRLPDSMENEKATLIHLCNIDSEQTEVEIARMYYENKFKIRDYSYPENSPLFDATDSVWACKLPDNALAFHINVTGDNYHLGRWRGVALSSNSDNIFIHKSFPYGDKCELTIQLKPRESILFSDVDCEHCCGARARLTGEYKYQTEIKLFSNQ